MASLLDKETEVKARRLLKDFGSSNKNYLELVETVRAKTIEFVKKHPDVIAMFKGKKHEILGAQLKMERDEFVRLLPSRIAEIFIYDYSQNAVIIQEVDLRSATLLNKRVVKGLQPPLNKNELAEAKRIAAAHPVYGKYCRLAGVSLSAFPAQAGLLKGHPANGHRVFTIYFYPAGKNNAKIAEAVIDLSAEKVLGEADSDAAIMKKLYPKVI